MKKWKVWRHIIFTPPPPPVTNCHTFSDPLPPSGAWHTLWTAPCLKCTKIVSGLGLRPRPHWGSFKTLPQQNTPENRNCLRGGAKMGGVIGEKVGMGRDGLELDPLRVQTQLRACCRPCNAGGPERVGDPKGPKWRRKEKRREKIKEKREREKKRRPTAQNNY